MTAGKTPGGRAWRWALAAVAAGLVMPSLIILVVEIFAGNVGPVPAMADVLRRQFAPGHNLFLLAVLGLIPFAALAIVIFPLARRNTPRQLSCLVLGGLGGIFALMIPGHVSIWYPLYGPGHASSTAVIGFVFIPFACLVSLAIGLAAGWLVSRLAWFRQTAAS